MSINREIENAIELEDLLKTSGWGINQCNGDYDNCVLLEVGECEDSDDVLTQEDYREMQMYW